MGYYQCHSRGFDLEMSYLCRHFTVISLQCLAESIDHLNELPPNVAVVTFDDGYKDNYTNAYPILKKHNLGATVFVATGNIDNEDPFWWDKIRFIIWHTKKKQITFNEKRVYQISSESSRLKTARSIEEELKLVPDENKNELLLKFVQSSDVEIPSSLGKELLLSWDEIQEMSDNGITFGAHTVNHPIHTNLPLDQTKKEIANSKAVLEQRLKRKAEHSVIPNGSPVDTIPLLRISSSNSDLRAQSLSLLRVSFEPIQNIGCLESKVRLIMIYLNLSCLGYMPT
jgi:peptidoglycan/xylan/chitin deacetylase (PgdA/CDA1 family)